MPVNPSAVRVLGVDAMDFTESLPCMVGCGLCFCEPSFVLLCALFAVVVCTSS